MLVYFSISLSLSESINRPLPLQMIPGLIYITTFLHLLCPNVMPFHKSSIRLSDPICQASLISTTALSLEFFEIIHIVAVTSVFELYTHVQEPGLYVHGKFLLPSKAD